MKGLTPEFKAKLINGEINFKKLRAKGLKVRVRDLTKTTVSLVFFLVDEHGDDILVFHEETLKGGDSVSIFNLDQAFNIKIT